MMSSSTVYDREGGDQQLQQAASGPGDACYRVCVSEQATLLLADSNRYETSGKQSSQATLPVVNIDSENYMLRGVGPASAADSPRVRSIVAQTQVVFKEKPVEPRQPVLDMDMFYVRDAGSSLAGADAATAAVAATFGTTGSVAVAHLPEQLGLTAALLPGLTGVSAVSSAVQTSCARTMSFHALFCSCRMSCCCMCGSLCSADCHACFHSLCVRFAASYVCQRNQEPQPQPQSQPHTLTHDKVGTTVYYVHASPIHTPIMHREFRTRITCSSDTEQRLAPRSRILTLSDFIYSENFGLALYVYLG